MSDSHVHCSVFFAQSDSSALENATQIWGWVVAWLKPLLGISFTVLIFHISLASPPSLFLEYFHGKLGWHGSNLWLTALFVLSVAPLLFLMIIVSAKWVVQKWTQM